MKNKERFGKDGLLIRAGSRRCMGMTAFVLATLVSLVGSSAREPQSSGPARGGMVDDLPGLSAGPSVEEAADRGLYYNVYRVEPGDTLSDIAERFDLTLDTIVSFNAIQNARALRPGQLLKVPSISGILYTVGAGEGLQSIAAKQEVSADRVIEVNGLMSERVVPGTTLFLPDARLASFKLREISGDLFRWPARGWITTWYGWDNDPFTGARRYHNGLDIGVDMWTPLHAAMEGYVAEAGYTSGLGNYILLSHHGGWASLYGHLQSISVKVGQRVTTETRIGYSGNTGYSTGPHLHFSVFKNGRSVNPSNVLH